MSSLRLLHLNEDTSWHIEWRASPDSEPFCIVIDPWLTGAQVDYIPVFSRQTHVVKPSYNSIQDLEAKLGPVSAIVNTIEYTDHTHQETLRTARPDIPVFARPNAKKRIDSWKIFDKPPATIRHFNPKVDTSDLPDSLLQLASRAGWSESQRGSLTDDVSLLWVPTDAWFDGTGDKLHGVLVLKFNIPASAHTRTIDSEKSYSILYSPHGVPTSAVARVMGALNALPDHECVALIHHFDDMYIPAVGAVMRGVQAGADLANAIKPKYWIRTHDELKAAEGLIGKVQRRNRYTVDQAQKLVPSGIKVLDLHSGEDLDLINDERA